MFRNINSNLPQFICHSVILAKLLASFHIFLNLLGAEINISTIPYDSY